MKKQSMMLLMFLILNGQIANANDSSKIQNEPNQGNANSSTNNLPSMFKQIAAEFMYSYIDFDFDSTTGLNFNRFQGHSNMYSIGADHIVFDPSLTAGVYVFRVNTDFNSQFSIAPGIVTPSHQSIRNNTLYGHIRKAFNTHFDMDLAAGYGQNNISGETLYLQNTPNASIGYSNRRSTNSFASLNAIYKKQWTNLFLKGYAGILYSQVNSNNYSLLFQPILPTQQIPSLKNKITYVSEGAELGYKINSTITPFINGGLIQVAQFSNSRPVSITPINGSLPQLSMDQNGYRLGAGVTFRMKHFSVRLEEKYYNAGAFSSNQTLVGLEYLFS